MKDEKEGARIRLVEICTSGEMPDAAMTDELLGSIVESTRGMYQRNGFVPPWVAYLALIDKAVVGTCAFKSPPIAGRVEIAYFTLPAHEGQGIATAMARELIAIARRHGSEVRVIAQTLPEENASTSILTKLNFERRGEVQHPEDGLVWEWELR